MDKLKGSFITWVNNTHVDKYGCVDYEYWAMRYASTFDMYETIN